MSKKVLYIILLVIIILFSSLTGIKLYEMNKSFHKVSSNEFIAENLYNVTKIKYKNRNFNIYTQRQINNQFYFNKDYALPITNTKEKFTYKDSLIFNNKNLDYRIFGNGKMKEVVLKDDVNNKQYNLTKLFNEKIKYILGSHFSRSIMMTLNNGPQVFRYNNDLIMELKLNDDNGGIADSKYKLSSYFGYGNHDLTQQIIKDQGKSIFINLNKNKIYEVNKNIIKKNPYQRVLENNKVKYIYCGINTNNTKGKYQLRVFSNYKEGNDFLWNQIKNKENLVSIATDIDKNNFKDVLELLTGLKNISFKNVVIEKEYSVDNKRHIINTEKEFKRYVKC